MVHTGTVSQDTVMDDPFKFGAFTLHSRLIVGTGKYKSFQETKQALAESGTEMVTVALRRVDFDADDHLLNHIDPKNISSCPTRLDATTPKTPSGWRAGTGNRK